MDDFTQKKDRKRGKKWLIVLLCLLLAAGCLALLYFFVLAPRQGAKLDIKFHSNPAFQSAEEFDPAMLIASINGEPFKPTEKDEKTGCFVLPDGTEINVTYPAFDREKPGPQKGTFLFSWNGHTQKAEVSFDMPAAHLPVLSLTGKEVQIMPGEPFDPLSFVEAAKDQNGQDLTDRLEIKSNVNPSVPGEYTVEYAVTDEKGHKTTVMLHVTVSESASSAPEISEEMTSGSASGSTEQTSGSSETEPSSSPSAEETSKKDPVKPKPETSKPAPKPNPKPQPDKGKETYTAELHPRKTGYVKLDQKVDQILKSILKPGMTNEQKIKAIHVWIGKNTTYALFAQYDPTLLGNFEPTDEQQCLESGIAMDAGNVIFGKAGVCDHYAAAFKVLAQRVGYDVYLVNGQAHSPGQNGYSGHVWNHIRLNNQFYLVDTQRDDYGDKPHTDFCIREIGKNPNSWYRWNAKAVQTMNQTRTFKAFEKQFGEPFLIAEEEMKKHVAAAIDAGKDHASFVSISIYLTPKTFTVEEIAPYVKDKSKLPEQFSYSMYSTVFDDVYIGYKLPIYTFEFVRS